MVEETEYEKPRKRHTGLIVFLVLIAGILIGAGGCYYYFEYMHKDTTKTVVKCDKEDTTEEKLDVDSVLVKDLVARYDQYNTDTEDVYNNIYKQDIKKVSDIDAKTRLMMAYENTGVGLFNGFTSDELNTSYTKLFGNEVSFSDSDFTYACGNFKYDSIEKKYTYEPSAGCGGTSSSSLLRKITTAKIDDNNLYINVSVGLKKAKENSSSEFEILGRYGAIDDINSTTFDIDKDYKKLDKMQYKFSYDKNNHNYYLVSIKKIGI
ncbi:MAG: hypothetical protein IJF92_06075 [Bacilli bacterium]|nr:hypothetical protein [Bacilli bacterium]